MENKKDYLYFIKGWAEVVLIVVTVVYGTMLTFSLKDKELKLETLKVAIDILGKKPEQDDPLREWAIDVFEKYADPKPSVGAKKALREKPLNVTYLMTEDGHYLTDEDGNRLIADK